MNTLRSAFIALAIGAGVITIGGCEVAVSPDTPVVTGDVPPPPGIDQYYFWGGHYYYWHPDRHAYVIYNGHPPDERVMRVDHLPPRRH